MNIGQKTSNTADSLILGGFLTMPSEDRSLNNLKFKYTAIPFPVHG